MAKNTDTNYAELDEKALNEKLVKAQETLVTTKQSHRSGELTNPRVLNATRKDIARIKTALKQLKLKESE
ncbi:50S ribosomal protein L29 [Candidatus Saccharibacteria bacterium]|nr:MAG: 50S ribosomal protein L29 [Candidatus Saccharibacteria bacterium]